MKTTVLITRPLSETQIQYAKQLGLEPVICPAISIHYPDLSADLIKTLKKSPAIPWIFTSRNAVKVLQKIISKYPELPVPDEIYAVGAKTTDELKKLNISAIYPNSQNADSLADLILIKSGAQTFLYFRGNRSTGIIQKKLTKQNRQIKEIVVYQTRLKNISIPDDVNVNGILFYSPSAVQSFAQSARFTESDYLLFAIGPTTAKALEQETGRKVYVSPEPDTQTFLEYVKKVLKETWKK
ncbi:MAG: uroporphyrinogen-III synthase [Balneolaceae bacterium]